jgi:hypothetical protein
MRPPAQQRRPRRGSLAHATLARAALAEHNLERAATEATNTVEWAVAVKSSRSLEAVADSRHRLAEHPPGRVRSGGEHVPALVRPDQGLVDAVEAGPAP